MLKSSILPLGESFAMRYPQYLVGALRFDHLNFAIETANSGPRHMKTTLQSRFQDRTTRISGLVDGEMDPAKNIAKLCFAFTRMP